MWKLSHLGHHLLPISMNWSSPDTKWNVDEENGSKMLQVRNTQGSSPLGLAY